VHKGESITAGVAILVPAMLITSQVSEEDRLDDLAEYVKYPGATTSGYREFR
jgi:hypothetical protein